MMDRIAISSFDAMVYLERKPVVLLCPFIRTIWYAAVPSPSSERQRILPNGCVQVIVNLARDYIVEFGGSGDPVRGAASLVVGARSVYETVDTADMAELVGIVFQPGGFAAFARGGVDEFQNRSVSLEDVWGDKAVRLRERLLGKGPAALGELESFLLEEFPAGLHRNRALEFALCRLGAGHSVASVAAETGVSVRRFSQAFRERVGLAPKVWCRVQRFQQAVRQLHEGVDVRWAELAVECGYYDQAHFAHEFRAFSGIAITGYCAKRTEWANHIPE
jgi:AraC-like DNA-binding protein